MYNFPAEEQKILKFWQENKIFEKIRQKNQGKKRWSFLDGPITANNPMGVHHAWGRTYKDLFQRFWAMKGCDERYQNGFDCQGLWVEVEVEKELGFKTKKDIEKYGIDKFVEKCKERVKKYSAAQTRQSIRLGQWMDWDNSYYTMSEENNYAIWHFLKICWQKGYLYKGRDSVPWCPRCGTAISQHEILTEEYKQITHESVYMEYPIAGRKNEYLLVWTTTPWTLPGNVAVAADPEKEYVQASGKIPGNLYYLSEAAAEKLDLKIEKKIKGSELVGLKYQSPFDDLERIKQALAGYEHQVVAADPQILPITDEDGTNLVHIAPGAGSEDFQLAKKIGLPVIELIDESAVYLDKMGQFSGKNAKESPKIILDFLSAFDSGKYLFGITPYAHQYPTCWRCKTELVWRVVDEWYISMEKIRKPLMEITKKINWIPSFGKERELDWLKNMRDWLISKKRYWGLALPIFECKKCGNFEVIGSKEELQKRAVEGWEDFSGNSPHRPWVDVVRIKCKKCGEIVSRIKDVGNPWLDAGIVPFSTIKYFSDKKYWKKWFPVELVCESFPGQFKNWFYSILVMSAVLEDQAPVKTIFGYALVRDEKGEEMHKSKGNAIWFDEAVEKIGADPMRWMYAKQNSACNLSFGYNAAQEIKRKLLTLFNVFVFLKTYVPKSEMAENCSRPKSDSVLDRWILSKFNNLAEKTDEKLKEYNVAAAVGGIEDFFTDDLSLWYLRRSRGRLREESPEKGKAAQTLYYVVLNLLKLVAPIMPFFAEQTYLELRLKDAPESVHLCDWPKSDKGVIDDPLERKMAELRRIVALTLAERNLNAVKVRQPLSELKIKSQELRKEKELLEILKQEVNVKRIIFDGKIEKEIELNLTITKELEEEGIYRDMVRNFKDLRKELGLGKDDLVSKAVSGAEIARAEDLLKEIGAKELETAIEIPGENLDARKEIKIKGQKYIIGIKK